LFTLSVARPATRLGEDLNQSNGTTIARPLNLFQKPLAAYRKRSNAKAQAARLCRGGSMRSPASLFSVIVPTHGRPRQLATCLESLAQLQAPAGSFEVVVVDDGSPEPLDGVVKPYHKRLDLTLLRQPNGGPGSARNAGAAVARGRFLAFTDDDCSPAPDWLVALARRFEKTPQRMIGGRTVNRLTRNPYAMASQLIVDMVYAFYNQDPEAARFFASNNMAVPADLFRRLGGFDGKSFRVASEDRELCDRWLHLGHAMIYAPEAVVLHAHPLTLHTFCKQHFAYGRGAWLYHRHRASRGSGRLRDDFRFHTHLPQLLREPLGRLPRAQARCIPLLLGIWQLANTAGFFAEMLWSKIRR
jgi:glycosyltransferase involved in cell wall biosynthesis